MEVMIAEYNPRWPEMFTEAAVGVRAAIGSEYIVALEHIGSTSVPGLAAKPVIDMQVVVRTLADAERATRTLAARGYQRRRFDAAPGRLYFPRNDANGTRTHHLHVYEPGHPARAEHLLFRDYLRAHPDEAARYEQLKRELAVPFHADSIAYCDAKTDYVLGVLAKARA